jgi:hypothetical protein
VIVTIVTTFLIVLRAALTCTKVGVRISGLAHANESTQPGFRRGSVRETQWLVAITAKRRRISSPSMPQAFALRCVTRQIG